MTNPLAMPTDRRRRRTRSAVLDAAAELFLRQGFRRTGVDELAAVADVALSSIYANFPGGKADVYLALACRIAEQHAAEMTAVVDARPSDVPVELAAFDEYRRFHRENPLAFRVIGLADVDAADSESFDEARDTIRGLLSGLVDAATAASELPPVAARGEVLRWWATVNGLLSLRAQRFIDEVEMESMLDAERAVVQQRVAR